jgi:hypothetical protein
VLGGYFGSSRERDDYRRTFGYPTEADETDAADAIEWARTVDPTNDYLWNVHVIASQASIEPKAAGIAASIVASYLRDRARLVERKAREAALAGSASQWIGTEGEKVTVTATLVDVVTIEHEFGYKYLHKLVDEAGNIVKWFCSGRSPWDDGRGGYAKGETRTVTGTVKGHGEYRGTKETTLTRVTTARATPSRTAKARPVAA